MSTSSAWPLLRMPLKIAILAASPFATGLLLRSMRSGPLQGLRVQLDPLLT